MKLDLYYFDACPFCQLVLNKVQELKLKDFIDFKDIMSNPEYRQFHIEQTGRATTPCLYIDGTPLFESQDIVHWLEENKNQITGK